MKKSHKNYCPVAGMLNIVGDRWIWLILREAFYGTTRFSEFERNIGLAKNLLADRLAFLVDEGILEKRDVGDRGTRYAYQLTPKGTSLETTLIAMHQWGLEHLYEDGLVPIEILERETGKPIKTMRLESQSGRALNMSDLSIQAGPSASKATRARFSEVPTNEPQFANSNSDKD
ncbi:MAG: helix-turn-helix domain-containing protein [Pseudomonadota bacterium]